MSARSTYLFPFLFLLMSGIPAYGAGLEDADERLFKVQLAMAEKGESRAQYYLGEMHEQGLGTRQDVDEAFKWYAKAAEQGDSLALRKLAHRKEIITEIKQEQEAEKLKSPVTATKPGNSGNTAKKSAAPSTPVAVAQTDQAQLEQERIKAAEREKRRAMVRAMILERMRNPVGELFE